MGVPQVALSMTWILVFPLNVSKENPMQGHLSVPFHTLVQDTIKAHGLSWAARYYAKRDLPLWQFVVFAGLRARGLK